MFEQIKGVVLNTVEYSDKLSIVRIYTDKFGMASFTLPNARSKKAAVKRNLFQPLNLLELVIDYKSGRQVQKIKEARADYVYSSLAFHPLKSAVSLFLAEVVGRFIQEQEENQQIYVFLENSFKILDLLDGGEANFHLVFLFRFIEHLGIAPQFKDVDAGFLLLDKGLVVEQKPLYGAFFSEEVTGLLIYISRFDYMDLQEIKLNRIQRNLLTESFINYLCFHLNQHITIKSFEVLRLLFE